MDVVQLFDLFRSDVVDTVAPYLWSDDEVWEYMDDAQKEFCRRTWGIADSRSALTQISVAADDDWVDISPRILRIRGARRASDGRKLSVISYEQMERMQAADDDYGMPLLPALDDTTTGPLKWLITGMDQDALRLSPIAAEADTIRLTVDRLPATIDADEVAAGAQLEIADKYHRTLLLWMKHRAYSKQDADAFDKGKAAEFEARFAAACAEAKVERERLEQPPGLMAYGGL